MSRYFEEHRTDSDHSRQSLRGGAVSIAARAVNALVQIGSVLFLARLLSPEDYGLVSMVTALTGFAPLFVDLGTRDAMVQRARVSEREVSALFWIAAGIGSALTLVIALAAPLVAHLYGEPRLMGITLVSSLTFVTAALTVQHQALLRRTMEFRRIAASETLATVSSAAIAIWMAFNGFGYWALVFRPIGMNAILAASLWAQTRWLPKRPAFTPGVREMLRFGLNLTGFTMTDFVRRSADRVAIGLRSGAVSLGHYQNALFVFDNLLDVLVMPLHSVAVASFSKMRDDRERLKRSWAKALGVVVFFTMPAFGMLAVTSRDAIVLLLGEKWTYAGVLLSVLALRGIPSSAERTLGWLHVAADRTDRWMRWGIFAAAIQMIALAAGLPFGAMGVAASYSICMFLLFVPALAYAGAPLQIGSRDVLRVVWRPLFGSLLAAGVCFILRVTVLAGMAPFVRAAVLILAYSAMYLAVVAVALNVRTPLTVVWALLRDAVPQRFQVGSVFRLGSRA